MVKISVNDPALGPSTLKHIGGSGSDDWNRQLMNQSVDALWTDTSDPEERKRLYEAAVSGLIGIGPKDELEGMMAAQLIASHSAAMECYRRAMIGKQPFEIRRENLSQANKLSRTFTMLLEALNRHRGKGQQKVTVKHVHVHEGGQAIVGNVTGPRGDSSKSAEQPHAIAHSPQPEMRSTHQIDGEPLPVACDEKRPLPDARREIAGSAEGQ
jgi:hypothetical protein